jgi:MFS family permease
MQLSVDAAVRGRVMALYTAVFFGGTPIGAPMVGWLADHFGARWSLIGGGGVSVVATVLAALLLLRRQHLVVRASMRPRPHLDVRTTAQHEQALDTAQQS